VLLPGRASGSVVVTMALAQSPVLRQTSAKKLVNTSDGQTCFPTLVRPRASRRLCTGLVIQLMRGSRRTYIIICHRNHNRCWKQTYSFVARIHKNNLEILVNTVLVHPVRVQDPQISAAPSNAFLRGTPETALGFQVVDTLTDRLAVGGTWGVD
jgi:hypothetical protein